MYRIPSRFAYRYYRLGILAAVLLMLTLGSFFNVLYFSYMHHYYPYLIDVFIPIGVLYLAFEIHNFRSYRGSNDDAYYFDEEGIYRESHLIAEWSRVSGVTVVSRTVRDKFINDTHPDGGHIVTERPLNDDMRHYGAGTVDIGMKTSRIEIRKLSSNKADPDITVYTSHFRPLLHHTYSRMKKLASEKSSTVRFSVLRR